MGKWVCLCERLQDAILAEKTGFNFTRYTAWTVPPMEQAISMKMPPPEANVPRRE
jgi:hypothetical protein